MGIYRGNTVYEAPDFVVEILSPSNRSYDQIEKARHYAETGVPDGILDFGSDHARVPDVHVG